MLSDELDLIRAFVADYARNPRRADIDGYCLPKLKFLDAIPGLSDADRAAIQRCREDVLALKRPSFGWPGSTTAQM